MCSGFFIRPPNRHPFATRFHGSGANSVSRFTGLVYSADMSISIIDDRISPPQFSHLNTYHWAHPSLLCMSHKLIELKSHNAFF